MTGTLYLIPNTLGEGDDDALRAVLPEPVRATASRLGYFVGENAKATRAFLKRIGTELPIQQIKIGELNVNTPVHTPTNTSAKTVTHTSVDAIEALLAPLLAGQDGGLVSDAGCPAVADPGALLVRRAHALGIKVVPLVGPSSILLALMASGLDGQRFAFHGYLPTDATERGARLRELEKQSRDQHQTQIFIETPYRNAVMFDALLAQCAPTTAVSFAADLTLGTEEIATRTVSQWRACAAGDRPNLGKRPAIFLLLAKR
jgi:16S rRNA (cytidine1402-2'-O)-methyltransferase